MTATYWTHAHLDEMRQRGDPLADEAICALMRDGSVDTVNELMKALVLNDGLPSERLPPVILDYLEKTSELPWVDPVKVARCETLFGFYGPEILMVLGFYSLPANYAARECAEVLCRTGFLVRQPMRRVFETTQMVIDVMAPGGLGADGRGVRTAQKVRLMHAAVRYLVSHAAHRPWDPAMGVPVNQEDLAGTLMTFSYLVLDGLRRLGIPLSQADQEAWLHAWVVIGRVMGIDESLLPANMNAARTLTTLFHQRRLAPSSEGTALTLALVDGFEQLMPEEPFRGVPASFMHFFLDVDPLTGRDIAEMLEVPPADWTEAGAHVVGLIGGALGALGLHDSLLSQVFGHVSRHMIEALLRVQRGGSRAPFFIPEYLRAGWRRGRAA